MNSFFKGFLSLFDWMSPKTVDETIYSLDNQMQDLYDRMGWGNYNNPCSAHNTAGDLTRSISSDEWNNMVKDNKSVEEVYGNARKDNIVTVLNKDERFAIYWCFNRAMDYVEKHSPLVNPYPDTDLIVNGVNISETIKNLLGRLVV